MQPVFRHALVYGDTHYPYHAPDALDVIKKLALDVKPDVVVHVGDLIDAWQISRFDKEVTRKETLQDDIDIAVAHLKEMADVTPHAKRYLLEGNHEFRLTKAVMRMKEPQRELAKLRVFQKHVTWKQILAEAGIPQVLWEFVPSRGQARRRIFPKLVVKHGSKVTKWSGGTAKAEWEKYGISGVSGHTHRLGVFYHRDFNGNQAWAETGCTCDLEPEYVEDPDWQHGCLIMTFDRNYKYFSFEPVYIQEGHAMWRDNRYTP